MEYHIKWLGYEDPADDSWEQGSRVNVKHSVKHSRLINIFKTRLKTGVKTAVLNSGNAVLKRC
jgi:hypothetical protein